MRKFGAIIGAVVIIGTTAFAVDMNKKIGFGVGPYPGGSIWEPVYFSMRMGIGPVVLEPRVVYLSDASDDKTDSTKTSDSDMGLGVRGLFPFIKKESANFYGTFGFGFDMLKTAAEDYSANDTKLTTSGTVYEVFFGLALERFIKDKFSVCISSESSFSGGSSKADWKVGTTTTTISETSDTDLFFGNTKFGLMFFWYL